MIIQVRKQSVLSEIKKERPIKVEPFTHYLKIIIKMFKFSYFRTIIIDKIIQVIF